MTVVVGIEHKGRVYMAGDSAATDDHMQAQESDGKVWVKGPYVMGFAGNFRAAGLLRSNWEPPEPPAGSLSFMRTTFVRSLDRHLTYCGATLEGTDLLVGVRGKLYHIEDDLSVHRYTSKVAAIGDGACSAMAVVLVMGGSEDPKAMVKRAVQVACQIHPSCGGKVVVKWV